MPQSRKFELDFPCAGRCSPPLLAIEVPAQKDLAWVRPTPVLEMAVNGK